MPQIIMFSDIADAIKRRIYLMSRDVMDYNRRQTLADEAQEAEYIDDLRRQISEDENKEATYAEAEIDSLRCYFQCLDLPCKSARNEICEFILDINNKSNEQLLEWLNSWWARLTTMDVPLDECKWIARALCQYFVLQHGKCLFLQPSLTGFFFTEEVCVYVFARDDFDTLAYLFYEREARQLF